MKKLLSSALVLLLALALALPALASNQGASPADITFWQTQAAAPCGEFQKIITVLGDKAAPTIQQRLDSSQQGAVIDNTPRGVIVITPAGPVILRYVDLTDSGLYDAQYNLSNEGADIYYGEFIHLPGLSVYLWLGGDTKTNLTWCNNFIANPPADALPVPTPDNAPVYDQPSGLPVGTLYEKDGTVCVYVPGESGYPLFDFYNFIP